MSNDSRNRPFGEMKATVICRAFRDAELKQMTTNDGSNFEIVSIGAVCSPYQGSKDPEPYWLNLTIRGAATKFAQTLKKGTEMVVFGAIRPRVFMAKNGEPKMSVEIDVSRDIGSIQVIRWPNNRDESSSGDDKGSSASSSNVNDDLPF